jgi:hypothetical protein
VKAFGWREVTVVRADLLGFPAVEGCEAAHEKTKRRLGDLDVDVRVIGILQPTGRVRRPK